jgi:glycosyltransferase involved in cell wall biosynthesis
VSTGESGTAKIATTAEDILRDCDRADLILIDGDPDLVLKLATAFLLKPWKRKPIIAVDLVLRRPQRSRSGFVGAAVKRLLYSRVDHYIHYFKDLREYDRYFGIGPERSSFVDFKPNIRYRHEVEPNPDGEYVLCFGRSMRDYDTFFDAMEQLPWPGAVPEPNFPALAKHGSRFSRPLDRLPKNVRLLKDDGSTDALVKVIGDARVVVLPILKESLLAGVGTYLNAMYMKKCVIISDGAGSSDVLSPKQAMFVPPEDARALAEAIDRAWKNDKLRNELAEEGYRYAASLGGEPELRQRILENALAWMRSRNGRR